MSGGNSSHPTPAESIRQECGDAGGTIESSTVTSTVTTTSSNTASSGGEASASGGTKGFVGTVMGWFSSSDTETVTHTSTVCRTITCNGPFVIPHVGIAY